MKAFKINNTSNGAGRKNLLKKRALIARHKAGIKIQCIDCQKSPTEFHLITVIKNRGNDNGVIPSPTGYSMTLLNKNSVKVDFLKDVCFRCEECTKIHHNFINLKESEGIQILKQEHLKGGDIYNLNPIRTAFGTGKR